MIDRPPVRIAMWSGPRNISTAMMRAFGNRLDTAVSDEPFYAAYLAASGLRHPMRDAILASQPTDAAQVSAALLGPVPGDRSVWYQKHMTHHMLPSFDRGWIDQVCNVFLMRKPEAVLASYVEKRAEVTLEEIGLPQQTQLFDRVADRLGEAPPVLDASDVLAGPATALKWLCDRCGISFDPAMLAWPAGPRPTDGVWAPAWYDKVVLSTGFGAPRPEVAFDDLRDDLKPIAHAARPLYEHLARFRIAPAPGRSAAGHAQ